MINVTCEGGSSSVLSRALNAAEVSIMHLVDDVNLALAAHRSVAGARNNLFSHVINAGVRGSAISKTSGC